MTLTRTQNDISTYGKKYYFYYHEASQTVVCTTMYKGCTLRGTAKCSPEDMFNIETGKKLAYLRCKKKYAKKKLNHANRVYKQALSAMAAANECFQQAADFFEDSEYQFSLISNELADCENTLTA